MIHFLSVLRTVFGIAVGIFVGSLCNMGIGFANTLIFPMPEGISFSDAFNEETKQAVLDWIGSLPQTAFILVLLAHLSQAFVGGLIAGLISKNHVRVAAMVVGCVTLLGGVMNMMTVPAPVWLWIEMPLYLVCAWWAGGLASSFKSVQ
tara:strand:+ start:400 stop:843 length:444 start_codon:yes stop_codon:yes gene_type:complete